MEIVDIILQVSNLVSLIAGVIAGWLGKRQKDQHQERKVAKRLKAEHNLDYDAMARIIDRKVKQIEQENQFAKDN